MPDADIRIPSEARDRLAETAAGEGLSLRAYLARLAETQLTPAERSERAEQARTVLREWNGYALIHRAPAETGWFLYATVCSLVEADRDRPGTAEHIEALPGVTIVDLDLPAALAVARAATWSDAHTLYAAQPSPERPDNAVVATTKAHTWKGQPVRVLDLAP
ncbi:hypothetical protein [Streptomyces paradoxus]|uniref:hypothetical protein n=1 Tax=Streptomyces paradoxus TaxID=66375 RepID=UPI0037D53C3C